MSATDPRFPGLLVPCAPAWRVDHEALRSAFPWLVELDGVQQNPEYHAEGDVGVHTRMVLEAMAALPGWRARSPETRAELFFAALLHDVAKPEAFRVLEDGSVTTRGHAALGERKARRLLWELGVGVEVRERICAWVADHLLPFVALGQAGAEVQVLRASVRAPIDGLVLLAEADGRGRRCAMQDEILESVGLFRDYARELGCLEAPFPFATEHARFLYFRSASVAGPTRSALAPGYEDVRGTVTLMSGLPGSGKSTWVAANAGERRVISLDRLRAELKVEVTDNQGPVVAAAREAAREELRAGRDFVWDATNLTRALRKHTIDLCADYRYRVEVVCCEASPAQIDARNGARAAPVPSGVIQTLVSKWEPPDLREAHSVVVVQAK